MFRLNKTAQSIAEYTIIIGFIAAGLVAARVYMQRGVQSAVKLAADELGVQEGASGYDEDYYPVGSYISGNLLPNALISRPVEQTPAGDPTLTSEGAGHWFKRTHREVASFADEQGTWENYEFVIGKVKAEE